MISPQSHHEDAIHNHKVSCYMSCTAQLTFVGTAWQSGYSQWLPHTFAANEKWRAGQYFWLHGNWFVMGGWRHRVAPFHSAGALTVEVLEITKPATSILQRLRTYCTFAEKAPYWKGRQPYCDVSRDMEDMHDLLHTCPQYVSEREILQDVFLVPAGHLNAYKFFFSFQHIHMRRYTSCSGVSWHSLPSLVWACTCSNIFSLIIYVVICQLYTVTFCFGASTMSITRVVCTMYETD